MRAALDLISLWAIPVLITGIVFYGAIRKVRVYEVFVEGAKEGFEVAVKIIPFLVAILVAIGMFRGSGAMELLTEGLRPVLGAIGFPPELFPLAILRSLSGSGSLALVTDLINTYGPDSLLARTGATMYGSTETTFYILAVYFGAINVRKMRHAVAAGLIAEAAAAIMAIIVCRWMFL
ncbi:MAG TPA: nucleoside recognition domain-containing protein [Thermoanaerobaculia bacterium]